MGILIDSSVLIAWERDPLNLQSQLADCAEEDFAISAITASELLHGVHRAANPAQRRRETVSGASDTTTRAGIAGKRAGSNVTSGGQGAQNGSPMTRHGPCILRCTQYRLAADSPAAAASTAAGDRGSRRTRRERA